MSLFVVYHGGMSIVRVGIGFFDIDPSIVTGSIGLHTFCHFGLRDIDYPRVCGRCRQALYRSAWQT